MSGTFTHHSVAGGCKRSLETSRTRSFQQMLVQTQVAEMSFRVQGQNDFRPEGSMVKHDQFSSILWVHRCHTPHVEHLATSLGPSATFMKQQASEIVNKKHATYQNINPEHVICNDVCSMIPCIFLTMTIRVDWTFISRQLSHIFRTPPFLRAKIILCNGRVSGPVGTQLAIRFPAMLFVRPNQDVPDNNIANGTISSQSTRLSKPEGHGQLLHPMYQYVICFRLQTFQPEVKEVMISLSQRSPLIGVYHYFCTAKTSQKKWPIPQKIK